MLHAHAELEVQNAIKHFLGRAGHYTRVPRVGATVQLQGHTKMGWKIPNHGGSLDTSNIRDHVLHKVDVLQALPYAGKIYLGHSPPSVFIFPGNPAIPWQCGAQCRDSQPALCAPAVWPSGLGSRAQPAGHPQPSTMGAFLNPLPTPQMNYRSR